MDATLILIDSDDELLRARALVDQLWKCPSRRGYGRVFLDCGQ